jgi:hypothetical protein
MTVSPLSGFFGPQAVITVVRGVVVIVDTKQKAAPKRRLLSSDSVEIGSGNHVIRVAAIMIIAVDLGLAGPQAVSSVDRRGALHHRDKNKGRIRRCRLYGSDFIRF